MACLFGHKWQKGICKKCGMEFAPLLHQYIKAKDGKRLQKLLSTAAGEDRYCIASTWEPMAALLSLQDGQEWMVDSLKVLYEYADKNTSAFLLGRTGSANAAEFLMDRLSSTRLGNYFTGHGVALHDLKYPAAYATVQAQCDQYSVDLVAPFYYALGAYKKPEDAEQIGRYIRRFIARGKHAWGFSESLRYAVAGMAEIGGADAFDTLMDIESELRADTQSKANRYEHRAVILYGLLQISRRDPQMTDRLVTVLAADIGNNVYNSYHRYILAQVKGAKQAVIHHSLSRLNTLLEGACNRYQGTDCEAVYCLYALGENGWKDYAAIKPRLEAWLTEEDRFIAGYAAQYFAAPKDPKAQDALLSHATLQQFIHIESSIHTMNVAYLPQMDERLVIVL